MKRLLQTETIFVAAVIILAIFLAKFPTLYHFLNTPEGYWHPRQTSWFDAWDTNFQVSYMRYGQIHGIGLTNTYTTIPHEPVYIYQYYTFLGVMNRILKIDPFLLFHLATIVTGISLMIACYFVAREFFQDQFLRLSSFVVMVLGGGLGFISFLPASADSKIAGFTLVNALERGHDGFSTLILLVIFLFFYKFLQNNKRSYLLWILFFSCISITMHPPFIAVYLSIGLVISLWQYFRLKTYVTFMYLAGLIVFFALYYIFVLASLLENPGFSGLISQQLFNVDSFSLALGFGFLSPFIFSSIVFGRNQIKYILAKLFFYVQLFFIFSPLGFHLYFVKGIYIWGVLLAFLSVTIIFSKSKHLIVVVTVLVLFSLFSRLYIFQQLMNAQKNNPFFFLTQEEGEILASMNTLPKGSAVLSLYRMGNYIPAFSDVRVYYGHKFQTPQGVEKLNMAKQFYVSDDEKSQQEFLKRHNINYIYYGLEEAKLREEAKLKINNPFPQYTIFSQRGSFIIYQVTKPI